jgi:hypothetical protein
VKTLGNRHPATDAPLSLDTETLDDLDPQHDTAGVRGGRNDTCETCTRTCASKSG